MLRSVLMLASIAAMSIGTADASADSRDTCGRTVEFGHHCERTFLTKVSYRR